MDSQHLPLLAIFASVCLGVVLKYYRRADALLLCLEGQADYKDTTMPTAKGSNNAKAKPTTSGSDEKSTINIFAGDEGSAGDSIISEIRADTLHATICGVLARGGYISFTSPADGRDTKISFASGSLTGSKWCADVRSGESTITAIAKAVGVL